MVADFPKPSAQTVGYIPASVQAGNYDSLVKNLVDDKGYQDPEAVGKLFVYDSKPLPYLDADSLEGMFASQMIGGIVVEGMEISANATPTKITIAAGSYYVGEFKQFATQQPTIVNPDNVRILYVFIDAQGVISFSKEWKYGAAIAEIGQVRVNGTTVVDVFNKVNKVADLFSGFGDFITHSGIWWHGIGIGLNAAHTGFYSTDGFLFTSVGVTRQFLPGQNTIVFNVVLPDGSISGTQSVFTIADFKRYYSNGSYQSINSSVQRVMWFIFIGSNGEFYLVAPVTTYPVVSTIAERVVNIQDNYQRTHFPEFLDTMATPIGVILVKGNDSAMTDVLVYSLQDNMSGGAFIDQNKGLPFPSPLAGDVAEPFGNTQLGVYDGRFARVTKLEGVKTNQDGLILMCNGVPVSINIEGSKPTTDGRYIRTVYTQNRLTTNGPSSWPMVNDIPNLTLGEFAENKVWLAAMGFASTNMYYPGSTVSWTISMIGGHTLYNELSSLAAALGEPEDKMFANAKVTDSRYHYFLMADLEWKDYSPAYDVVSKFSKRIPEMQDLAEKMSNVSRGTWFAHATIIRDADKVWNWPVWSDVGIYSRGVDGTIYTIKDAPDFIYQNANTICDPYIMAMSAGVAPLIDSYLMRLSNGNAAYGNNGIDIAELFKTEIDSAASMRFLIVPNLL